ncbi:unnamed protein product [Durusdinium trenchii]|uniref:Uncharacterized protein n=1 Tax=Durusdinium trenchii TaxID=1381693 RepID=A0ABP0RQQ6_9DINO
MGCGASAEKKAEEPPATDSSAAPAAASAASPAAEAAESKAEEPKAELTSTTDGKEVPMEQKVQLAAAPQAESSAPANPCTAAPEMLEAMQKLVDATAQEQKGLKVQEVLKVQNAQMQHRYDHFAADLHRNFGSSIARHVVLTDDLGPAELRKEINEMYLFHGTSPTEAKQIASSDFDFKEEAGLSAFVSTKPPGERMRTARRDEWETGRQTSERAMFNQMRNRRKGVNY